MSTKWNDLVDDRFQTQRGGRQSKHVGGIDSVSLPKNGDHFRCLELHILRGGCALVEVDATRRLYFDFVCC